ncbi:MAG TPA: SusC/RagA family TonB-linked outer membrane protein [Flavisolibacter sp.]|jgi:TonB-linked SusC/RagA family outer membrane protein|nr:SusC/RagA family TonB-linked outer membrane protein [Flavisolibacter sp.]
MRNILRFQMLVVYLVAALLPIKSNSQQQYAYSSNKTYNSRPDFSLTQDKQTLLSVLKELNKTKGVYFLFSEESIGNKLVVPVKNQNEDVEKILNDLLQSTGLSYKKINTNTYVIVQGADKLKPKKDSKNSFFADNTNSQNIIVAVDPVKGKITTSDGVALSSVTVQVKGTTRGTTTNANGEFIINANRGETLVVSYVGYLSQEVVIGASDNLSISLTADPGQINESVVVTALGIRKEARRLGYSVTKVNGDEFTQSREINIGNALTGRVAGVNSSGPLTGPGGSSRVLIRGINSLTGDNQPLYVINGVPMNNANLGNAGKWGGSDLGEGLTSINPDDVEEITVLKGGAAAALYGQIAKNGVILITTKSGKGKKGTSVELNSNVQLDKINNFLDFQNVYGQGTLGAKPVDISSAMNTGMQSWGAKLDGSNVPVFNGQTKPYSAQGDNLNRFYQTGSTYTNTLAVTGGNEMGNYRLSMGDLRNSSIYPNSKYIRNTATLDLNYKMSSKWSGQASIIYAKETGKNRTNLSDAPGNGNYGIMLLPPNVNADYLKPGYDASGNEIQFSADAFTTNPYFAAAKFQNNTSKNRLFGVGSLRFQPFSWLYMQARVGNDFFSFNATQITPTGTAYRKAGSLDNEIDRFYNQLNTDVLVGANKNITKDLSFGLTAGANLLQERQRINTINASGLAFPYLYNPGAATTRSANTATPRKDVRSVYGSLELAYKNFLFINATDRNDWSSTIPIKNNSYNYPSVNASYIFSEHLKAPWLSFGKLRVGYSQVGADADPFQTALYYATSGAINGQPIGNLGTNIPNNQLEPLQIREYEVGTQLGFLKNRLNVDVAVYKKQTLNDIVQGTVSITSGYQTAVVNVGKVENKGIEVSLTGNIIKTKDFRWSSSFNFAYNKNTVVELAEGQNFMSMSESRTTMGFIEHRLDKPAYQVMVYDFKRDAKGQMVLNASGFPQPASDLVAAGTSIPPTVGGWNNQLGYKNFGLEFLLDYKFGAVIYSGTNARAYAAGLQKETLNGRENGIKVTGVDDAGNSVNKTISAQDYYGALSNISMVQTYSADFIKLRSLSLSYNIPAKTLNHFVQGITISLVGRNLLYLKRDTPNIDPEANYSNSFSYGLEYGSLPSTKSFGLNVNVRF